MLAVCGSTYLDRDDEAHDPRRVVVVADRAHSSRSRLAFDRRTVFDFTHARSVATARTSGRRAAQCGIEYLYVDGRTARARARRPGRAVCTSAARGTARGSALPRSGCGGGSGSLRAAFSRAWAGHKAQAGGEGQERPRAASAAELEDVRVSAEGCASSHKTAAAAAPAPARPFACACEAACGRARRRHGLWSRGRGEVRCSGAALYSAHV